jgi:GT2 family glycosyltransferase
VSARLQPVAVIICTRDRPALLADAIASIRAGTAQPSELVVVDQSATPNDALADDAGVTYVHSRERGLGRARNIGAAHATSDLLAYCDDDVLADAGWLEALLAPFADGDVLTVATGRVLAGPPERRGSFVPAVVLDDEPATYTGRLDRDVLAGGNSAIRRATLEHVGWWDDRLGAGSSFPSAEDNDLGLRLLEAGCRIVYVPGAVLTHRSWRPGPRYPLTRWRYGLGKGAFYTKHALVRRAARDVGHRPVHFVRGVWKRPLYAAGELAYATGVVAGALIWVARGRRR